MTKGISLHIGLNYVDPNHYAGWDGKLSAAEYDANDMYLITKSQGIEPTKLIRDEATRGAVIAAIKNAAAILPANSLFVISFSGHGGQLPDISGEEDDGVNETWCLFDGEIVDNELFNFWSFFQKGVRILVISDSCHSGTVIKSLGSLERSRTEFTAKFLPSEIASMTYYNNKQFYDNILENAKDIRTEDIQASVKLISSSQDNQKSYDGTFNSQFTLALKKIWNGGKFDGNYFLFYNQIMNILLPKQKPNYFNVGQPNQIFDNQKPFSIK